jgi:hypothetical protein
MKKADTDVTEIYDIPPYIFDFISKNLKERAKNDVVETLLLLMLHFKFVHEFEKIIEEYKIVISKGKSDSTEVICRQLQKHKVINRSYDTIVEFAFKSTYFVRKFKKSELKRRKIIAKYLPLEIFMECFVLKELFSQVEKSTDNQKVVIVRFFNTQFPSTTHEIFVEDGIERVRLTFDRDTSYDNLQSYILDQIGLIKKPSKPHLSLWEAILLKSLKDEVENEREKIKQTTYTSKKQQNIGLQKYFLRNHKRMYDKVSMKYKEITGKKIMPQTIEQKIKRLTKISSDINKQEGQIAAD